jgi:enterochelin esterase family protein
MPGYQTPPELLPAEKEIPAGAVTSHTLNSDYLNQVRTFFVYTPAGQLIGQKLPSVYIHDGGDYLNLIDAAGLLDRLIAQRLIPPIIAVFIPPISRNLEYNLDNNYAGFLSDEVVPFIQENYQTDPDPSRTATLGASMGGLAAIQAAITRPDVFGLVAGQSGAYSVSDDAIIKRLLRQQSGKASLQPVRFYLVVGTYETAVGGDREEGDLLAANRRLVEAISTLDQEYLFEERPEGHSWGLWRGTFGRALGYLFNSNKNGQD